MPHLPSVVNIASMKSTLVLLTTLLSINVARGASKAELNAKTLEGQKVHLKDLRGKLVVLNFWATWCGPCREELPMLVKAAQAAGQPDLVFIAVSVDDSKTEGKVPDAVRQFGITFPVWRGATGDDVFKLSKGEAVPAKGKPTSPPPVSRAANPPTPIKKKSAAERLLMAGINIQDTRAEQQDPG